jgi:hypothetical protein
MNVKLVIDYKEAELSKKDIIAMSYGVNRLTDIKTRQGYYSNTFKLPKTATNLDIFGNPDQLNSTDTKRWERLTAWIEVDGVQIVYGFAELVGLQNEIEVVVKGGNTDWIQLIKDKNIQDVDLDTLDHTPTSSVVNSNRFGDYTNGFVYPDIDYGPIKDLKDHPDFTFFKPAVFADAIFEQIFTDAGFTVQNELTDEEKYLAMLFPFSNQAAYHSDAWKTNQEFKTHIAAAGTIPDSYTVLDLDDVTSTGYYDNGSHVNLAQDAFHPGENVESQTFKLILTFTVSSWVNSSSDFDIRVDSDGNLSNYTIYEHTDSDGAGTFTKEIEFELHDYTATELKLYTTKGNCTVDRDEGSLEVVDTSDVFLYGSEWNVARNLPDMMQTDFVKFIVNTFCALIIPDTINKVVTITTFENAIQSPPEDWSEKADLSEDDAFSYSYGDYKEKNFFKYDIDTDDLHLQDRETLGEYVITNSNNASGEKELYKAPFSLSWRDLTLGPSYIEKCVIDLNTTESNYTTIKHVAALTISSITTGGLMTVSSGANQLRQGDGLYFYNTVGALLYGGQAISGSVVIVGSVNSDTEVQLEGSFSGSPVTSGNCRTGFMPNHINLSDAIDLNEDDEVWFYDLDGSATQNSASMNGKSNLIQTVLSQYCVRLVYGFKEYTNVTNTPYEDTPSVTDVSSSDTVTEGNIRVIKGGVENNDTKPRVGLHEVVTDSNFLTIYGESTPTQSSEVNYEGLKWDVLVPLYWPTIESIIQAPQILKKLIRLSPLDVYEMDFTRPKFLNQHGSNFYLSYVDQFKTNEVDSTEVELVKLPA